jgi:hypothetical protein
LSAEPLSAVRGFMVKCLALEETLEESCRKAIEHGPFIADLPMKNGDLKLIYLFTVDLPIKNGDFPQFFVYD